MDFKNNELLQEIALYSGISFIACFLFLLKFIKTSYKKQSVRMVILNNIFRSFSAIVISICAVLLLPEEIYGINVTSNIKLGIVILSSIYGQGILDYILEKKFGFKTIDLMNKEDMDRIYAEMSLEEKQWHYSQCPFKDDGCNACEGKGVKISLIKEDDKDTNEEIEDK